MTTERKIAQNPMIKYATQIGWDYIDRETSNKLRDNDFRNVFYTSVFKESLHKLNPFIDESLCGEVIRQLGLLKPNIEGNKKALEFLKTGINEYVQSLQRSTDIQLIDFENIDNNVFQVTDEWRIEGLTHNNRADIVFLINGIPIALAETKNADKELAEGVKQIRRYHKETPEMFITTQLFEATEVLNFFYGVTWNTGSKGFINWKEECKGSYEFSIKQFFDRKRLLELIRSYIVFLEKDSKISKIVLKQHQTRAVEKVIERVKNPNKRRGLIWHTQGSGKTVTMITIASKLLQASGENTVLMVIDRNELEGKLEGDLLAYGIKHFESAYSKKRLKELLGSEDYRGLIVSMIHKFDDLPANLNTRDNVIVLIDEAHRTTSGDFGNYLEAALPNAQIIGFTGTPISKLSQGRSTFHVFGRDDESGYLDKYSMKESIEDKTTLTLNYSLAESSLLVDKEVLEKEFLSKADSYEISDPEELNKILDKSVTLREQMKSPDRIDKIAKFIAKHFKENVEPLGFKAFVVGVDREACALYKQALDKYLPPEYSLPVYTQSQNDDELKKKYYLNEDTEKTVVKKDFPAQSKTPKILIVTDKLLTGYDAPVLYCMYLDKPMRDHVLLQTIARVNRPYEAEGIQKPCGFVIDFVGIFDKLEEALAFDSEDFVEVIKNVDTLKDLFEKLMKYTAPEYLKYCPIRDDKALEQAVNAFEPKNYRDDFYSFYKQIQSIYEILSPDAFLRPYIDDFRDLSFLYNCIKKKYSIVVFVDDELANKTKQLVRENTFMVTFTHPEDVYTLDAKTLDLIRQSNQPEEVKVINLSKLINKHIEENKDKKAFLISIGNKAQSIVERYESRLVDTRETLEELEELLASTIQAEEAIKESNEPLSTQNIYSILKIASNIDDRDFAKMVDKVFYEFPDYEWDQSVKNNLKIQLIKVLNNKIAREKLSDTVNLIINTRKGKDD